MSSRAIFALLCVFAFFLTAWGMRPLYYESEPFSSAYYLALGGGAIILFSAFIFRGRRQLREEWKVVKLRDGTCAYVGWRNYGLLEELMPEWVRTLFGPFDSVYQDEVMEIRSSEEYYKVAVPLQIKELRDVKCEVKVRAKIGSTARLQNYFATNLATIQGKYESAVNTAVTELVRSGRFHDSRKFADCLSNSASFRGTLYAFSSLDARMEKLGLTVDHASLYVDDGMVTVEMPGGFTYRIFKKEAERNPPRPPLNY